MFHGCSNKRQRSHSKEAAESDDLDRLKDYVEKRRDVATSTLNVHDVDDVETCCTRVIS